ncbi:MAG TPA: hypothetical protein VEN81_16215, partial [Planctomycetota bacterium]|nr:hypothetical protein [Planctomycetota bacterium]
MANFSRSPGVLLAATLVLSFDLPSPIAAARQAAETFPLWDGKESVTEYAKRAHFDPTLTLDLGGVPWEGMLIPAGTFVMGSPPGEAKTPKESTLETPHRVTITRPFYMGKFELT